MSTQSIKKGQISKGDLIKAGKAISAIWGVVYAGYSTDYDRGVVIYRDVSCGIMEIPLSHVDRYI